MTTFSFLRRLQELDVRVWAEGDRLRFSAAPGALDADLRAELTRRKAEVLEFLSASSRNGAAAVPPVSLPRNGDAFPLSFAQQQMWLLSRLDAGSGAYNVPLALRIRGPLDPSALEASLTAIVRRHEILRTTYAEGPEESASGGGAGPILQRIVPDLPPHFSVVDVSLLSPPDRDRKTDRLNAEALQRPFDLAAGPFLRGVLIRRSADEHVLSLALPHIACDGWSLGVLLAELAEGYEAHARGAAFPVRPLALQYADFAVWQRERMQGALLTKELSFWKARLDPAPPPLDLPADRPRPNGSRFEGARRSFLLPSSLTQSLRDLAAQEGATLFMALLASLDLLLMRMTGQEEISIGTAVANRPHPSLEGLIGCFANTLVLRTSLSGDLDFRGLLRRVRDLTLDALTHQELPFETLVEELAPRRDPSRSPLFQVMLILQSASLEVPAIEGLTLSWFDSGSRTAKFDLTFSFVETSSGLAAEVEYATALFDEATIESIIQRLEHLIAGITAAPDTPVRLLVRSIPLSFVPIVVSATFTAEPLAEPLTFFAGEFGAPIRLTFAPFGRVLPELLAPASALSQNGEGVNVILVRWSDWLGGDLEASVSEFLEAFEDFAERRTGTTILCLCPSSGSAGDGPRFGRLDDLVVSRIAGRRGAYVLLGTDVSASYRVETPFDSQADALGKVPFSDEFFAALGHAIVQKIAGIASALPKSNPENGQPGAEEPTAARSAT